MTELWQAYGSWVVYGMFFLAFVWMHTRMHGHGGHACHGGELEDDAVTGRPQAGGQPAVPSSASTGSHAGHAAGNRSHSHRGGCC